MIRTQISMTESQAHRLRLLSSRSQRSQAALLRDALDTLLDVELRQRTIDRARRAAGAFSSAPGSVSVDHDAELDAAFSS
jgi:hypothetical protein